MQRLTMSRRAVFTSALATLGAYGLTRRAALAAATEIKVPDNAPADTFDFESKGIEGWTRGRTATSMSR